MDISQLLNGTLNPASIQALIEEEQEKRRYDWKLNARPKQLPPPGDWQFWVAMAGRGWGKTRVGAEFVRSLAEAGKHPRIAIVGATAADVRDVMVEGESGILSCSPNHFRPEYTPSKSQLTWPNGVIAKTYSAEEPNRLRGPQHHAGWLDELAAWEYPDAFTQFKLGFRSGRDLRCCITSTPKPCPPIRELVKQAKDGTGSVIIVRGSTYENRANLAPAFFTEVIRQYEGTRLGRQELDGELLEDTPGALWNTVILDRTRCRDGAPEMSRIVVAIDPSVTNSEDSDECGISVCGKGVDGDLYVMEDLSESLSTLDWARRAISAFHRHQADVIIGEVNNGGDLVENTLRMIDPSVPFRKVTASRGKHKRAEPVAALWEQGKAHLVGNFPKLEEQLCAFASDGYTGRGSPDRGDSMVWGATELMLGTGTVQMFPDFRAWKREKDPENAAHVINQLALKEWWPRWVSVTVGGASAAHWWCREPSGRMTVYREFVALDMTPEAFGLAIAERSKEESAVSKSVPVWMSEKAFDKTNGKSLAHLVADGINRGIGEQRAFLFVHTDAERSIPDQGQRTRAIQNRIERMPRGFLSVQALRGGKDQSGWDIVREMLRWRSSEAAAKQETPDWDYALTLASDVQKLQDYVRRFGEVTKEVLPLLVISSDCKALIQAMSGAVRSEKDDSALAVSGAGFVLQSLRIGALASREDPGIEPQEEFIGRRMERIRDDAPGISRAMVAEKAESDWHSRYDASPVTFSRVKRPGR